MKLLTQYFQKKYFQGLSRSKITKKGQRGQISNMSQSSQTIRQNEALGTLFSNIFVSRSFKVTRGQESQKNVQFQTLSRVHKLYSGGGVLRDSRALNGWKWRHRALQSLIAAVSEGFEQLKYAENDQINQFCQNLYLEYVKSIYFNFLSHNGVKSRCLIIHPPPTVLLNEALDVKSFILTYNRGFWNLTPINLKLSDIWWLERLVWIFGPREFNRGSNNCMLLMKLEIWSFSVILDLGWPWMTLRQIFFKIWRQELHFDV